MTEEAKGTPPRDNVTIIREGHGSGGVIVGLIALVLIALAAFWAFGGDRQTNQSSVSAAADKVGAAADKVGAAADDTANSTRE